MSIVDLSRSYAAERLPRWGTHSEFFEPPHRYERLLMVLRRSIHLTSWECVERMRSECLVITKVGQLTFVALRTAISG